MWILRKRFEPKGTEQTLFHIVQQNFQQWWGCLYLRCPEESTIATKHLTCGLCDQETECLVSFKLNNYVQLVACMLDHAALGVRKTENYIIS